MLRFASVALATLALASSGFVGAKATDELSVLTRTTLELDNAYRAQHPNKVTVQQPALTNQYDANLANHLYWHSVSAYCTDDVNSGIQNWTCKSCIEFGNFTLTAIMDDTTNQGYVGYFTQGLSASPIPNSPVKANEPFVVVSFRGTLQGNLKDWIQDLSLSKTTSFPSHPDVHVHGGFWQGYQDVKDGMMAGIEKAIQATNARAILLTGHSLGGAMAELAALDLKLNYYNDLYFGVYTQGTPRSGDAAWAALYSSSIETSFREIHYQDVVPHLPPTLLGFEHGPTEVWWDEQFQVPKVCSVTNGEDSTCADSQLITASISDHLQYHNVGVAAYCSGLHATKPAASAAKQHQRPVIKLKEHIIRSD